MADEKGMVKYEAKDGQHVTLSFDTIKKYLVQGRSELVTNQEMMYFMGLCKSRGLNPFIKDCYLIKYSQETAAIVTSVDYFRKRARAQRDCKGWKKGIIVERDGQIVYSDGLMLDSDKLLGGWFQAQPDGWIEPMRLEVNLKGYIKRKKDGSITKFWAPENQPSQIMKVAESQGLRTLWPDEFQMLYAAEEMDQSDMFAQAEQTIKTSSGVSDLADKIKEKVEEMDQTEEPEHHQLWSQNQQKQAEMDQKGETGKAGKVVDAEFKAKPPPEDKVTNPGDKQEPPPDAGKQDEKAGQSEILCPYCKAKIKEVIATYIKVGGTSFACPVCHKQGYIRNGLPVKVDETGNHESPKAAMKKQSDEMIHGIDPALAKIFGELTNNGDAAIFWRMREKGLDLFFDTFEDKMNTWPKEIQDFVMAKCKNIAGKHPEFVERFEKAITVVTDFPALDGDIPKADNDEDWNGLYYDCPNMDGKPIPRVACKKCDRREGCPTPFVPKQAKQEEMKF